MSWLSPFKNRFLCTALLLLCVSNSYAKKIVVKKTKGRQAIIESTEALESGKTYYLTTDEDAAISTTTDFGTEKKSRYNSISLGGQFSFVNGNNVTDNTFSIAGRYGWNHSKFEFGPSVNLMGTNQGYGMALDYLLGGYFDYNWVQNKYPMQTVYGPSIELSLGNKQFSEGGSARIFYARASAFITWYINNSAVAIRSEAGYSYKKITSSQNDTSLSGLSGQFFLLYYF